MARWRACAIAVGVVLALCGLLLWAWGGGVVLLICGAVVIGAAILEPAYGALVRRPAAPGWRATDEKFVDPETGRLVTVWFDPATGERLYVGDGEPLPPA